METVNRTVIKHLGDIIGDVCVVPKFQVPVHFGVGTCDSFNHGQSPMGPTDYMSELDWIEGLRRTICEGLNGEDDEPVYKFRYRYLDIRGVKCPTDPFH